MKHINNHNQISEFRGMANMKMKTSDDFSEGDEFAIRLAGFNDEQQ